MKVKVEMIIETDDFGEAAFKKEIKNLIADIDTDSKLLQFDMFEIKPQKDIDWGNVTSKYY